MEDNTLVGIRVDVRDRAKIHVVRFKHKYGSLTDLVSVAVAQLIDDDEHDF